MRAAAKLSIPAVFVALVMASACSQRNGSKAAPSANVPGETLTEGLTIPAQIREPKDLVPALPTGLWPTQNEKNNAIGEVIVSLLNPHLRSSVAGWELFWAGLIRSGVETEGAFIVAVFKQHLISASPGIEQCAVVWLGREDRSLQGGARLEVLEWGGWYLQSASAAYYLGTDVLRLEFGQTGPQHLVDFILTSRGPVIERAVRLSDGAWTIFSSSSQDAPVFVVTMIEPKAPVSEFGMPESLDTVAEWRARATEVLPHLPEYGPLHVLQAANEDVSASTPPIGLHAREKTYAILPEYVLLYLFYLDTTALRLRHETLAELSQESGEAPLNATLQDIRRRHAGADPIEVPPAVPQHRNDEALPAASRSPDGH